MPDPRTIRLASDDNVVVAVDQIPPAQRVAGVTARERVPRGHKMAIARDRARARRCANSARSSASPRGRSRRATGCTSTTSRMHDFARDYRFAEDAQERRGAAAGAARDLRGLCAAERQGRHAQLYRRPHLGELLGLASPASSPRRSTAPACSTTIRSIDGVVPFVHGTGCGMAAQGRGLRRAAAHAMGLRHPSQPRRRADGRARLRGVPDRPHEGGIRPGRGRHLPDHDHPGDRRHQEDRRATASTRIKAMLPVAARAKRETRAGLRDHAGAAMRRLGRLFRHHRQSGARRRGRPAGRARRHRRCSPRRRRSTAPSIC